MALFKYSLSGLHCEACKKITEKRIKNVPGVISVSVDSASGLAEVRADKPLPAVEIDSALEGTDYHVIK